MPMNWDVAAVVAALAMACVLHAHWKAHRRAWPAWTLALSGARRALVQWLRQNTGAHLETLEGTLRVARDDHDHGRSDDALHVIGQADKLAAGHVHWLRSWLQRWADVTRTRAMPAPTPPAPAGPTQLPPLRRLAVVQRLGDTLLPTRTMRFQTSVRLQRLALKWVGWSSAVATLRARRPGRIAQALDQLDATHTDLVRLDQQAMTTLEHLLRTLPADPRAVQGQHDSTAERR